MKRFVLILMLVIQGCSISPKKAESVLQMRSCYEQSISFENSDFCFIKDEFTHLRREANIRRNQDFWKAFSDYRMQVGAGEANQMLKRIVDQFGLSTALFVRINDDLRGAEVDRIVDSMLLATGRPTKLLVEQVGIPCDLALVNKARGIARPKNES